ncbi:choice-of-anchor B family protein [Gammaproteobacteria bacterium AB-CW1]|uniref:Choice-of-anchor B family protein n=1 Tax=Natronospira elongata TaxID=3110268 RepID=A0AAP6JFY6_9GAMM|nr:choice-of-anchor B family protein [Gammaproteobacteria bacterium AB-CW1]
MLRSPLGFLALAFLFPLSLHAHEEPAGIVGPADCVDGEAAGHPCSRIDLLAFMPADAMGGPSLNDVWGWTDPESGREYAIVGRFGGTSFIDLDDPANPVYLGELPTRSLTVQGQGGSILCHDDCTDPPEGAGDGSLWRDIKVFQDHAFIVSEEPDHGLQVFDLRQLRTLEDPPYVFEETAHLPDFGNAHNIELNRDSGRAYVVGATSDGRSGGPIVIDVSDPSAPERIGEFHADGYTHDAQCVVYEGPDMAFQGQEVCFNSNEDHLTIVDMTEASSGEIISSTDYPRVGYTHQGWLSEDQHWFYMNDELDNWSRDAAGNMISDSRTRTLVWDVSDLGNPELVDEYYGPSAAIAHNNYVKGDYLFQSNYTSGLRILDISTPSRPVEYAWFDVQPGTDSPRFEGSWSNYPWFESGIVVFTDIGDGLFIAQPRLPEAQAGHADILLEIDEGTAVAGDGRVLAGQFRVTVENRGPEDVSELAVVASLPVSGQLSLVDDGPGNCELADHVLRCRDGELASGASLVFDLEARASEAPDPDLIVMASSEWRHPDTTASRVHSSLPEATDTISGEGQGSGSGSGCSLAGNQRQDPLLPGLFLIAVLYCLSRRKKPAPMRGPAFP